MFASPLILAVDTALGATGIALWQNGQCLAGRHEEERGRQAAMLLPWIGEILAQSGAGYADIDRFAVTVGPGGFTGIRVGLAAMRALALATGKPAGGFSTLQVMAGAFPPPPPASGRGVSPSLCLLPGGRGQYFAQRFLGLTPLGTPQLLGEDGVRALLAPGDTLIATEAVTFSAPGYAAKRHDIAANARILAALAADSPVMPPSDPLYIRPPDAEIPRPLIG